MSPNSRRRRSIASDSGVSFTTGQPRRQRSVPPSPTSDIAQGSPVNLRRRRSPPADVDTSASKNFPAAGLSRVDEKDWGSDSESLASGSQSKSRTSITSLGEDTLGEKIAELTGHLDFTDDNGRQMSPRTVNNNIIKAVGHYVRHMAPTAMVIMSTDAMVMDINPAGEAVFGVPAAELIGNNIKVVMPASIAAQHDAFVKSYVDKYLAKKKPPRSNIVGQRGREVIALRRNPDGTQTQFAAEISVRGIPHPNGRHLPPLFFVGYVEDVSERNKLKEALKINEFIRERGDTPLIVMNDTGIVLEFNEAACAVFRYHKGFIIGHNIKKLMPPSVAETHDEKLEQHRERKSSGMLHTSPVVGKVRQLTGWRPKFDSDGCEEFPLELRVESFAGGVLVAFVRDLSAHASELDFREKVASDTFPKHTVPRLMKGEPVFDVHSNVTVMFTDLVQFSRMTAEMPPEDVFQLVNNYVSAFDEIGAACGMEKIKTIGDGYMCYFPQVEDGVVCALRMLEWCAENETNIRIGLHSGEVVSGVVGSRRRTFDMWGDTVNFAKRMEETGTPKQLQISGDTYDDMPEHLIRLFTPHTVNIKHEGALETYITNLDEGGNFSDYVMEILADYDLSQQHKKAQENAMQARRSRKQKQHF